MDLGRVWTKSWLAIGAIAAILWGAEAADPVKERLENSMRHHEWVEVPYGDGEKIRCFVVFPEVSESADSVIVIHENRGLTDWVRAVGDRLAEEGFVALCPDFLTGKGPGGGGTESFATSDDARTAIYELDAEKITQALKAIVPYLRGLPSTTDRVSTAGFCWGGAQTFRFATNEPTLHSAHVWYGSPPEEGFDRIECPVYGYYGENDNRINSSIEATVEKMKAAGKTYEPVIYDGVGHAFLRAGMGETPSDAEKKADTESWTRLVGLLKDGR